MCSQSTVPLHHEWTGIVLMLEFGHKHPILSIEGDCEEVLGRVFTCIEQLLANVVEIRNKIRYCGFWCHGSILESDAIRDNSITEDDSDITTIIACDFPWRCQIGHIFNIDVVAVLVGRLLENLFIGHHPFDSDVRNRLNHSRRNCFLTRPHSSRAETEFVFKQVHPSDEMILHILWPCFFVDSNTVFHGPTFHHEQRHNWVVIRCRGEFNLSVRRKFTVHWQYVAHVSMLCIENVIQIGQFVIPTLHKQVDETLVTMTRIVGPEDIIR